VPIPWLQLIDAALGVANFARGRAARPDAAEPTQQLAETPGGASALGHIEARLAGVVVAALREAFDRDTRRLELEREQMELERRRAERALRLELMRQAADREIGRLRLVAGAAIVSWLAALFFSARLVGGPIGSRVALGAGWALLLAAAAAAFAAQSAVAERLRRANGDVDGGGSPMEMGAAGAVAPWLIVVGLAAIGLAVLIA
jgi:hypothetical protein